MKDFFKPEESRNAFRARKQNEKKSRVQEITSSRDWRPWPTDKNFYVSKAGYVFSLKSAKILRKNKINSGYHCVHVYRAANKTVHSIVLETWSGPRPKGYEAAHLNGIKTDNRLENLKWCTKSENQFHRRAHGTDNRGEKHPLAILSEKDLPAINRLIERGKTQKEIGEIFGVSAGSINHFIKGKTWKHV